MTADRAAGATLVLIGLITIWQSRALPLGSFHRPGPAYMPVVLAVLLMIFGVAVFAMGARAQRLRDVGWHEWRHPIPVFPAGPFAAWGLERLGYRPTTAGLSAS